MLEDILLVIYFFEKSRASKDRVVDLPKEWLLVMFKGCVEECLLGIENNFILRSLGVGV